MDLCLLKKHDFFVFFFIFLKILEDIGLFLYGFKERLDPSLACFLACLQWLDIVILDEKFLY